MVTGVTELLRANRHTCSCGAVVCAGLPAAPVALVLCPMAVLESALKLGDKPASGVPPLTDTFSSHDITVGNIDSAYIPAYSGEG